ncbi:MAG: hypothetical protein ACRYFU_14070 [Janthinobacterium lividum]
MIRSTLATAVFTCSILAATLFNSPHLQAQSTATASRAVEPSVFLGISGDYTGLNGSRNLGVTAGADFGFHPFFGFLPAIEVRGSYPVNSGVVVGEESVQGGLRVQKRFRVVRPYVDVLFGRGELKYQNGGYVVPAQNFSYLQSTSNVFSAGLGFEIDATEHFALLLDGQAQHWTVPFTPGSASTANSSIYSKAGTIGVVYRFGWLDHGHPAP